MCLRCTVIYLFFITINNHLMANDLEINFSHTSGYYTSPFDLFIEPNTSEATIFYSINKPFIPGNAIEYESSILINTTTTVNVMLVLNEDTIYKTNAYLFFDEVKTSNKLSDHITKNDAYKNLIDSSFLSIPTLCLNTTKQFSVTDSIGPVEVPSSVVFILPHHKTNTISINCGLQTWGGSPANPKKNYRLEFKSEYGPTKLNFDLFNFKSNNTLRAVTKFDKLLLRAGSQDGLNAEFGNELEAQYIKNRFIYDVVLNMGQPAPHGFFTHVFINNKYAGMYHLMEAPDEFFFKSYFFDNYKKDSIEIRKNRGYVNQPVSPTYYSTLLSYSNGLNTQSNYNKLTNFIDVDAAAVYITYHHFFNSFDWSDFQNTLLAAVPFKSDGKFQFSPWDFDFSLGARGTFTETYVYNRHGAVPENLFNAPEFKFLQGDKVVCYCTNNGTLTNENLKEIYQTRANEIKLALIAEAAKWGNTSFDAIKSNIDVENWEPNVHWQNKLEDAMQYLNNRTKNFIEDYKVLDRFTNVLPVEVQYKEDGFTLSNPNGYGKIMYTLNGSDPRNFNGILNPDALVYNGETICVEKPSKLIARVYVTTNIDVRWSNFCPVIIYSEQSYNEITINEIHYKPVAQNNISAKDLEFVELKNKGNSTIFLQNVEFNEGIHYKFSKTDSLLPNQLLVLASDSANFIKKYGFKANGIFKGSLSNSGELLNLIDPFGNIIDQVNYTSIEPWPVFKDTIENSIALLKPELDNALAENWAIYPTKYSPGLDNDFCSHNSLKLHTTIQHPICFNGTDGTAAVTIDGGKQPYSITWSNRETLSVITNLNDGVYNINVQDAYYCTVRDTIVIESPANISIDFVGKNTFVSGGNPPYSYLWSNGETGKKLVANKPGSYELIITDVNGCTNQKTNIIKEPANCDGNTTPKQLFTHNLTSTSIILFWDAVSGGSYEVKYASSNEQEWHVHNTNQTVAVLYNLEPCTKYYYSVAYLCDDNINRTDSGLTSFETKGCDY